MKHYPSMYPKGERPLSGHGRYLVMDAEAIGLVRALRDNDPSSMHCIVVKDDRTNEVFVFFDPYDKRDPENREYVEGEDEQDGYLWDGMKFLSEAECVISQNFSGYDALAIEKVFGKAWHFNYMERRGKDRELQWYYPNKLMDTYVMSCTLNPERKVPGNAYMIGRGNVGPHSIEAHGIRIGRYKPENEDWSKLTTHMLHRCEEDVHIGQDFYHYLMKEWQEHEERPNPRTGLTINTAYRCELQTAFAIARQAQRGFRLDMAKALDRVAELDKKIAETEAHFRPHMPMRIKKKKLDAPVNGHTHGSYYATVTAITKKLSPKQWCEYTQHHKYHNKLSDEAYLILTESGGKITQKDWLKLCPIEQLNCVGEYAAAVTKHHPECRGYITDHANPTITGAFTPIEFEEIPLGNRDAVKQVLYDYGWRGINYNDTEQELIDKGKEDELDPWAGKIDEDSIEAWSKRMEVPDWCKGIAAWYVLCSRRNQILNPKDVAYYEANKEAGHGVWPRQQGGRNECRGLIAKAYNKKLRMTATEYYELHGKWPSDPKEEWRVSAEAFTCATNTFRMRHKVVVNIPSRGLYPLRDLFIAGIGKKILGCDGSGLELRMLAHFMADAVYQEVVLNGDIHTYNQLKAGLPLRDMAKTFIYAFLYGSGIRNLAAVCGISEDEMAAIVERFKRELPALSALIERIQEQGEYYGYLLAVDGRRGVIRSKDGKYLVHTMLNVLLQMTGSLSMKYGLCFAERNMIAEGVGIDADGYPAWLVNMHDEVQSEVDAAEVEEMVYQLPKDDWKGEEKRIHYDEQGRMWSAPHKCVEAVADDGSVVISVVRHYHRAGHIIADAMTQAGEFLKLRCPLAGEYKIGDSWADTH